MPKEIEKPKKDHENSQGQPKPHLMVSAITRNRSRKGGKDFFTPCGVAFPNSDYSLNILLNRLPFSGEMHIRSPKDEVPCWKALPLGLYEVYELPDGKNQEWRKVGMAFGNQDNAQSLNVILNLVPETFRLQVRLPKKAE